jgi:hypothetical protein
MAHRSGNENKNTCIVAVVTLGTVSDGSDVRREFATGHPLLALGVATQKICRAHSPFSFELNFIERQGGLPGSDD